MAKQLSWEPYEDELLYRLYSVQNMNINEIADMLGRSKGSVSARANRLKYRRPKEIIPEGMSKCTKCKSILPLTQFSTKGASGKPYCYCLACQRLLSKKQRDSIKPEDVTPPDTIVCLVCKEEKPHTEFSRRSGSKTGRNPTCKICDNKRRREYTIRKKLEKENLNK